jgi:hypothetical protein
MGGSTECMRILFERDPLPLYREGFKPLSFAVICRQREALKHLLKDYNLDASTLDSYGNSALHLAAVMEEISINKILVETEPSLIMQRNHLGETPLTMSLIDGKLANAYYFIFMIIQEDLFFCDHDGLRELGPKSVADYFSQLEAGNNLLMSTADEALKYISHDWPERMTSQLILSASPTVAERALKKIKPSCS